MKYILKEASKPCGSEREESSLLLSRDSQGSSDSCVSLPQKNPHGSPLPSLLLARRGDEEESAC